MTLRALSFVALFQAAGVPIFLALFGGKLTISESLIRRHGVIAGIAALVLVLAHYFLEAARMAGEFSGVFDKSLQSLVWASGSGVAMMLRVAGLTMIAIGLSLPGRRKVSVNVSGIAAFFTRPRPRLFPSGIGVAAVLLGFTFVGHTASSPYSSTLEALLLMHLAVAAFWFGSLWPLLITSRRESAVVAGEVVELFSAIAIWSVPVLALAGLGLAVAILKSIDGLWTDYGRLLLLKVAGVCMVLILAATNKWRHGPRLSHGNPRFTDTFCRTLVAEYFLLAGVLCLTAVLTALYSPDM